ELFTLLREIGGVGQLFEAQFKLTAVGDVLRRSLKSVVGQVALDVLGAKTAVRQVEEVEHDRQHQDRVASRRPAVIVLVGMSVRVIVMVMLVAMIVIVMVFVCVVMAVIVIVVVIVSAGVRLHFAGLLPKRDGANDDQRHDRHAAE